VIATKFGDSFDEQTGQRTGEEPSPAYIRRACQPACAAWIATISTCTCFTFATMTWSGRRGAPHAGGAGRRGKIRTYGWSTDDLERARFFAQGSHCTAIMHRLNIMMDAPEMLALCDEYDLASINRIPLAMGVLSGRWTASTQLPEDDFRSEFLKVPEFLKDLETVRAMGQVLTRDGRSYVQAALGWIWAAVHARAGAGLSYGRAGRGRCGGPAPRPISEEQMQEIRRLKLDRSPAGSSQ